MFKCSKCEVLEKEVAFLRDTNAKLVDRIIALSNMQVYGAVTASVDGGKDYFGGGDDEVITYDEYGQRMITKS